MNDPAALATHLPDGARSARHALGWMIVSSMLFAIVMLAVRLCLDDLPPPPTAALRYMVGICLLLPVAWRTLPQLWRSPVCGALAGRGVLHATGVSLWFFSINAIPLADVNAILNLSPVWATIGAALFLGERLRLRRFMAIMISFAGALIIIKPGFAAIGMGTMAVMVTAACFAFSDLIAKQLKAHHDDKFIIFALSVTITLVSLPLALPVWQPMSAINWIGILVIGVAATLGHVTLMRSFAGPMWAAQAGKYVQLLFVILFGITLFDEIPTVSTLLGAMVVLAGVSYIAVREGRRDRALDEDARHRSKGDRSGETPAKDNGGGV